MLIWEKEVINLDKFNEKLSDQLLDTVDERLSDQLLPVFQGINVHNR